MPGCRRGKGRKERRTWLAEGAVLALRDWLEVRGDGPGPLLCPIRRGGHLVAGAGLTPEAVNYILKQRLAQAGIQVRTTPHDFRRTNISSLLEETGDLAAVQKLAGHEDPKTTSGYDRRGDAVLERTARQVHVPYLRPRPAPSAGRGSPGALPPGPAEARPPVPVPGEVARRPA